MVPEPKRATVSNACNSELSTVYHVTYPNRPAFNDEIVTDATKHEFLRLHILSAITDITQAKHV